MRGHGHPRSGGLPKAITPATAVVGQPVGLPASTWPAASAAADRRPLSSPSSFTEELVSYQGVELDPVAVEGLVGDVYAGTAGDHVSRTTQAFVAPSEATLPPSLRSLTSRSPTIDLGVLDPLHGAFEVTNLGAPLSLPEGH